MTQHSDSARTLPPQAVQAVQTALHAIPMNQTVGVQITGVGIGTATGVCADTAPFRNHIGTIHAGAQFLLAEAVSGAAFAGAFAAQLAGAVPLIEKLETHYVARAQGDIAAHAEAPLDEVQAAHAAFAAEGKARLVLHVSVTDGEGKEVMRGVAHWYLRQSRPAR
jgi:acyl-coenzyme A thioesterase PaaI-like protein